MLPSVALSVLGMDGKECHVGNRQHASRLLCWILECLGQFHVSLLLEACSAHTGDTKNLVHLCYSLSLV